MEPTFDSGAAQEPRVAETSAPDPNEQAEEERRQRRISRFGLVEAPPAAKPTKPESAGLAAAPKDAPRKRYKISEEAARASIHADSLEMTEEVLGSNKFIFVRSLKFFL